MSGKSNYFQTEFTISVSERGGERDIVLLSDDDDLEGSNNDVIPVSFTTPRPLCFKREERTSPSHVEDTAGGPSSMASSSASIRRLEWDSGADVGYEDPDASLRKEHLSTVERLALGAAVLSRSDPEGTNHEDPPSSVTFCGLPEASSTPRAPTDRPLSPNVIVKNFGGISDSDFDDHRTHSTEQNQPSPHPVLIPVKSASLDNTPTKTARENTSTFPRCSNAPEPPTAQQAPSTSSSSSVTVVKRQPDSANAPPTDPSENDSPHSSGLAGDRANSFEYLPGRVYEEESKDADALFKNDLDRGVELLAEFLKNVNVDSETRKKRLIKDVVECLLAKNYPGDSEFNEPESYEPCEEHCDEIAPSKPDENSRGCSSSSGHQESSKSSYKDTTPPSLEPAKASPEAERLSPEVVRFIRSEKQKQLNWIKTEINHLKNLKDLLEKHESLKQNFNLYKRERIRNYREKLKRRIRENEEKVRFEEKKDVQYRPESSNQLSESTWNSHSHKMSGQLRKNASTNTSFGRCPNPSIPKSECRSSTSKKSLAYTITFDRPVRSTTSVNDHVFIAERDELIASSREHVRTAHAPNSTAPPSPPPPLQTQLLTKKPQMVAKAEFRRRAVAELVALRELRVENKGKILTAALNHEPLDPILANPLKFRRAVSNASMKRLTEKHYRKTAEVQSRKIEAQKKEEKQTNRLMAQIFNTKLQKKVLRGETHLPNTINVITC